MLDAARESGLIEDLPKRAAVAVAKFVSLYDRLACWQFGRSKRFWGTSSANRATRKYSRIGRR